MHLLFCVLTSLLDIIRTIQIWILSFIYRKKPPSIPQITDPLYTLSAATLAKKIRLREITSYEVVKAYIERIKIVNPALNAAVDERFEAALKEAKACDEQLINYGELDIEILEKEKPFFGIPFSVKESISVKGLSYTGGTLARKGVKATVDNINVTLLRDAGAIPLCVTNTPEMCAGVDSVNPIYGSTRNPYDVRFSVGGSSGGEGALVGAGASLFGVGSDAGGSIRIPAHLNGVFGYKSTAGITTCGEHFPSPSVDEMLLKYVCIGPIARYMEDISMIARIMTSKCDRDLRLNVPVDLTRLKIYYRQSLDKGFGVMPVASEIEQCVLKAAYHFTRHGVRAEKLPMEWPSTITEIVLVSLLDLKNPPNLLIDANDPKLEKNAVIEMVKALFGQSRHTKAVILFATMLKAPSILLRALHYRQEGKIIQQKLLDLLGDDGVFICPTFRIPTSFPQAMIYEVCNSVAYTGIANIFGLPSVHVPMGLNSDGLPIGVQVIAAPYQDRLCLAVAKELEKAFGGWVPPSISIRS